MQILDELPSIGVPHVAGLFLLGLVLSFAGVCIYNLYLSPLSGIPGPRIAAVTKLWLIKESMAGTRMRTIHKLHQKYGKVVRVAPNTISFSDPSVMTAVYTKFSKAEFYLGTEIIDGYPHSMASLEAKDWSPIRKMIAPTYSIGNVASYEGELTQNVHRMCDRIDKTASPDTPIDMLYLTRCVASDAVGLLGFGEDWGATVNGHSKFLQWIDGFTTVFIIRGITGKWFCRKILMKLPVPKLRAIFDVETQFINHTMKVLEPVKAQVEANPKLVDQDERNTLAIRCLGKEMTNGKRMPFLQASCEIFGHVYAGTDTTSVAVSYALLRLSENPEKLARLRKEVTEASGDQYCGDLSTLSRLPYLNAVIHETLRTDGPACSHLERDVPADGIVIDSHYIPKGTTVAAQGYTMHRNPAVFAQADSWQPERWLTTDQDQKKAMLTNLMPFGFGPRVCPGQNLAWADMRLLIATVVKRYDFKLAPGQNMELEDHFVGAPFDHTCKMYIKRV